jgi:hypothetical protein
MTFLNKAKLKAKDMYVDYSEEDDILRLLRKTDNKLAWMIENEETYYLLIQILILFAVFMSFFTASVVLLTKNTSQSSDDDATRSKKTSKRQTGYILIPFYVIAFLLLLQRSYKLIQLL